MDLVALAAACSLGLRSQLFFLLDRAGERCARPAITANPPGAPGTTADEWAPFVAEASRRFGIPERWIRAVVQRESGGQTMLNGKPITSSAGAMGLMQVMPGTYDGLRRRYSLGNDPYDPHDNILAGTAYLREMFDRYGSPAFLAAYNAGPGRLDQALAGARPLPDETVRYVAQLALKVAPAAPSPVPNGQPLNRSATASDSTPPTPASMPQRGLRSPATDDTGPLFFHVRRAAAAPDAR